MNKKIVNSILCKKHDDFVKSIEDEKVRKLVDKNSIITGGAIVSLLLNEKINDYDYYFINKETALAVAHYYIQKFKERTDNVSKKVNIYVEEREDRIKVIVKSAGIAKEGEDNGGYQYFETRPTDEGMDFVESVTNLDEIPAEEVEKDKPKYRPVFMTSNAITLSNHVQLVLRFYGNPEEIHKNYDFVHCTNYWLSSERKLYLKQEALESILARQLYYVGSLYPVASIMRTRKFIKRGWHINAGQYIKMCFQVSQLDLTNIEVLEDQLTGVDNAYFYQVIEWFKKKKTEDENFEISLPYIVSIIDRIF
ncbi:MAG: hypothetical protein ACTSPD_09995 [Promethearchaeota archaeon]